jgi:hypothetical protein
MSALCSFKPFSGSCPPTSQSAILQANPVKENLLPRRFMTPEERNYQRTFLLKSPRTGLIFVSGILVGSAIMYFLDPRTGTRRRVVARDRARSAIRSYLISGGKLFRHWRNKIEGVVATATSFTRPEGTHSDRKIEARVRSALGRTIPHPHAVGVAVDCGKVTLRGSLPPHQAGLAVLAVERVKGVAKIENLIVPPLQPGEAPLQQ